MKKLSFVFILSLIIILTPFAFVYADTTTGGVNSQTTVGNTGNVNVVTTAPCACSPTPTQEVSQNTPTPTSGGGAAQQATATPTSANAAQQATPTPTPTTNAAAAAETTPTPTSAVLGLSATKGEDNVTPFIAFLVGSVCLLFGSKLLHLPRKN